MGEKGTGDKPEPTLELPSLRGSFGRRKRARAAAPEEPAPVEAVPALPVESGSDAGPDDRLVDQPDTEDRGGARRRERTAPLLPALSAVVLTGLLVGLLGAGATYGGLQACEEARGTSSCGDSGFFILVAIVIVMMLLGAVLLKLLEVAQPRGVSFLGVGLLCVVVLVGPLEALFSPWMFVVVPALTAFTFAVGRWVTTRFVEPAEDGPGYDVR